MLQNNLKNKQIIISNKPIFKEEEEKKLFCTRKCPSRRGSTTVAPIVRCSPHIRPPLDRTANQRSPKITDIESSITIASLASHLHPRQRLSIATMQALTRLARPVLTRTTLPIRFVPSSPPSPPAPLVATTAPNPNIANQFAPPEHSRHFPPSARASTPLPSVDRAPSRASFPRRPHPASLPTSSPPRPSQLTLPSRAVRPRSAAARATP